MRVCVCLSLIFCVALFLVNVSFLVLGLSSVVVLSLAYVSVLSWSWPMFRSSSRSCLVLSCLVLGFLFLLGLPPVLLLFCVGFVLSSPLLSYLVLRIQNVSINSEKCVKIA
jgi:hypothetical protein